MSKRFLKRMTRAESRLSRPDSYYHVYTHAVEGLNPFATRQLKVAWLNALAIRLPGAAPGYRSPEVFDGIEVLSLATMSNHPHLVARQGEDPTQLSRFIGNALRAFALQFNRITGHEGQVFVRPYEAELLTTPADVTRAIMYVHRNPKVPELIVRDTSHSEYINGQSSGFVNVQRGLTLFGGRDAYAERFENYCRMRDLEEGRS